MRAVDTNLLVRLLVRDDERQLALAESFIATGAWISQIVLVETVWVLESVYERTHAQIASALDMLLAHADLSIQEPDAVAAAVALFRRAPAASFSDCLVLEVARKAGHLPLGTFDKVLSRMDGAVLPRGAKASIERTSARRLAKLGGSAPRLGPIRRRRSLPA
jgi:predicted nucleic-acid-binding protein